MDLNSELDDMAKKRAEKYEQLDQQKTAQRKQLNAARTAAKNARHNSRTAAMSEADLNVNIRQLCKLLGLRVYHTHDSRRSEHGWPDLAILGTRLLLRELKTTRGVLSTAQRDWLTALRSAGVDADVWRPADWPEHITAQLRAITTRGTEDG